MNIEVYRREDGKWAWRLKAGNHEILANDAGQGYENKDDAVASATMVTGFGTRLYESITLEVEGHEPIKSPILKPNPGDVVEAAVVDGVIREVLATEPAPVFFGADPSAPQETLKVYPVYRDLYTADGVHDVDLVEIFSSREKAEAWVAERRPFSLQYRVEEWEVL